jgi:glycosyltransferase involved in cell wall biosynthesis
MICLIVKSVVSQVGVQISIHGSYDSIFLAKGVKAIIKRRLLLLGISHAKSVRIVSESDLGKFQSLTSSNSSKLFVSPIPIRIPSTEVDVSRKSKIALVGRLHKERGISEFVEIFRKLEEGAQTQELLIVGGGPEEDWLRKQLDLCFRTNTQFLGHLDQEDLSMLWGDIKVLVSCAPQESYGMALREALANGSFVVAKKNITTASLANLYPELISTYSNPDEGASLIYEKMFMTPSNEVVKRIRESLGIQQDNYLETLAKSWIS